MKGLNYWGCGWIMNLWITRGDELDIVIDGIRRCRVWFSCPYYEPGAIDIFSVSYHDDFMWGEWRGGESVNLGKFMKCLDGEDRELFGKRVVEEMRLGFKWGELSWHDFLGKLKDENDRLRTEFHANNDCKDYLHYGFYQEACSSYVEKEVCVVSRKEWCIKINLFEVCGR